MAPRPAASARPAVKKAAPAAATSKARAAPAPPAAAPAAPAAASPAPASQSSSDSQFKPRLVPELHTQPTNTSVSDTVDKDEVVESLGSLEVSDGLGEDWTTSFQGLGQRPFDRQAADILLAPVVPEDVEVTPDGLIYLPEIKYRRILNRAFGPGGWGIAPRTKTLVTKRQVTREYGLVCLGRLVSVSRGEMDFFSAEGVTTAMEGCKSNALMRCCKDLGIASELWDPSFIREFKQKNCDTKYSEKKRRFVWKRKDRPWEYPYNQ